MIVSWKRNFILVKNRKVGGTSLEIMISPFLDEDDIITPINPPYEMKRAEFGAYPRNFCLDKPFEASYKDAVLSKDMDRIKEHHERFKKIEKKFFNHMPLWIARSFLDSGFFDKAEKYAVEREKFDKTLSFARRLYSTKNYSARRAVKTAVYKPPICFHRYYLNGKSALNRTFDYANFQEVTDFFSEKLGVEIPDVLVRRYEKAHEDQQIRLNDLEKKIVELQFRYRMGH